jgi:membrane-bound metal-dependent hydrolase YbcI (DUF457 family)
MKGIAHFITGVTVASFFPWSIEAALRGNPLYFVLGGAFGLLPDTLDFKFYRFFYRHDLYLEPSPADPDPQRMADQLAEAVAAAVRQRRTVRVKLSTLRLGADRWRQYSVRFDPQRGEVAVRFGPAVNTGQVPLPGTEPRSTAVGRARLPAPVVQTYEAETTVDIFDGPTFALEPDDEGRVILHFLPWHRQWSHSVLTGAVPAVAVGLAGAWRASAVMLAGYVGHLLEDQLGFMGSNLFFPFTRRRLPGAHAMRSGDALPNFLTVWICGLLLFWNLYRHTPDPLISIGFSQLLFFGGAVPFLAVAAVRHLLRHRHPPAKTPIDTSNEWGDPLIS